MAQVRATRIALGEYAATWIAQRNIKLRTKAHYGMILGKHLAALAKVPVADLRPETIRSWYAKLDAKTARIRSHSYGLVHAICATAVNDQLLQSNPCQIPNAMHTQRRRMPVILTVLRMRLLSPRPKFDLVGKRSLTGS